MNTLHLRYAVEVARTRSITHAAHRLYMAQPNLSKAIRELEDSLGIVIFERTSRGVVPTARGAEFLAHARNILAEIDRMQALCAMQDPSLRRLSVTIARGSYIAAAFASLVAGLDPDEEMEITLRESNTMQVIDSVSDGTFGLGVIRYQAIFESDFTEYLAEKNLAGDLVWEFENMVTFSKQHPCAPLWRIEEEALRGYTEIVHGDTAVPYRTARELRRGENARPRRTVYIDERCSQMSLLSQAPDSYMWTAPAPGALLGRYGLVQRRGEARNNRYKDVLIYRQDHPFTELEERFIARLRDARDEVELRMRREFSKSDGR